MTKWTEQDELALGEMLDRKSSFINANRPAVTNIIARLFDGRIDRVQQSVAVNRLIENANHVRGALAPFDPSGLGINETLLIALKDCLNYMESQRASGDAGYWVWEEGDTYSRGVATVVKAEGR